MGLELAFWVVFLLTLIVGGWAGWPNPRIIGPNFLVLLLMFILGWEVFGAPIHR